MRRSRLSRETLRRSGDDVTQLLAGQNIGVSPTNGHGVVTLNAWPDHLIAADQMLDPVTANWPVNVNAPAANDTVGDYHTIRAFDDTTPEGAGFELFAPAEAVSLEFTIVGFPNVAPAAARTVGIQIWFVDISGVVQGVGPWDAMATFDFQISTTFRQFYSQTVTVTLNTPANPLKGVASMYEITRVAPLAGTNLAGDFNLRLIRARFRAP